MRRIVLAFGLISGALLSIMMVILFPFSDHVSGTAAMVVTYAAMVAAFMLVYFGVRQYRDTVAGGTVSFGRAFTVGILIAAIASVCYVGTWQVMFYNFYPDYLEKYNARVLERESAGGMTAEAYEARKAELAQVAKSYRNPLVNAAYTILEPLPIGLLAALLSAALLRRRRAAAPVAGLGERAAT